MGHDTAEQAANIENERDGNFVDPSLVDGSVSPDAPVTANTLRRPTHLPFVAYEAIRDALVARGIPPHEIAFIQDATTRAKREQLMAAVRSGAVRVLLAGSQNTGLNVQDRLIAVHNADVPWRPGDLEQRIGRAQRQGNAWPEIFICNYAVEHSFDGYMWQTNEVKAQFIAQFERGDVTVREIDDIGGIAMTAAEMKAIASGNPQIRRKFQVESELARLDLLAFAAHDTRRRMHARIHEIEAQCEQARITQSLLRAAEAAVEVATTPSFQTQVAITISGPPTRTISKRSEAGAVVCDLAAAVCQLHGIERLERHALWGWSSVQRVVLAVYRGLLLECVVGKLGQASLMLALPGRTDTLLIPETALTAETDRGIFDSADAAIRQFGERISGIDRYVEQLESERRTILFALEKPWEHEEAYRALAVERDALLQALAPKDEASSAATSTEASVPSEVALAVSAPTIAIAPEVPVMIAPPVVLPPLRDEAVMQAARERIVAQDRQRRESAPPLDEVATHTPIPFEQPGADEAAHLAAVQRLYQPSGALVFGDTTTISQSGRRRVASSRQPEEPAEQLSLFG